MTTALPLVTDSPAGRAVACCAPLLGAGLVSRDKRGVWAYYRLVPGALTGLGELLTAPANPLPA